MQACAGWRDFLRTRFNIDSGVRCAGQTSVRRQAVCLPRAFARDDVAIRAPSAPPPPGWDFDRLQIPPANPQDKARWRWSERDQTSSPGTSTGAGTPSSATSRCWNATGPSTPSGATALRPAPEWASVGIPSVEVRASLLLLVPRSKWSVVLHGVRGMDRACAG